MLEEVVFQRQSRVFEFLASRVHQIGGFPVFLSGRRICDGNLITHGSEIGTGEEVVLTQRSAFSTQSTGQSTRKTFSIARCTCRFEVSGSKGGPYLGAEAKAIEVSGWISHKVFESSPFFPRPVV